MSKGTTNMQPKPEISLAYLHDIADGSNEFMVEMIDIFLQQTPEHMLQMDKAIQVKDWTTVAEIAHKVRPTFAFIGVDEATETMAFIENTARSEKDLDKIEKKFNQFKTLFDSVFLRLHEIRKELAG